MVGYRKYDEADSVAFSELKGKTIIKIEGLEKGSESATFECADGSGYRMVYYDDCCASASIEDIDGDLADLIGNEILVAEEVESKEPDAATLDKRKDEYQKEKSEYEAKGQKFYYESLERYLSSRHESETWVFYKLATIKGSMTIRWYGSSNGYYSESATFEKLR